MIHRYCLFSFVLILAGSATAQMAVLDDFNRGNGTNLGPDWAEISPDATIQGNQCQGNAPFGIGWMHHTVYTASYLTTVVRMDWSMNGFGGDAVSLIAGVDPTTWAGIEARIQDNNGDGLADRVFFNAAVNAGNWYGGPIFFNITNPLIAGRGTLWFSNGGDTANLEIVDAATGMSETFAASGILGLPPTGTRVGIGYFGNPTCDDFQAWTGSPAGPVYTVTAPRTSSAATFRVSAAAPNGTAILALSLAGGGPLSTPLGPVSLSLPVAIVGVLPTDAHGEASLATGGLPPSLGGLTVYHQAVDVTGSALTNAFVTTIL